MKDDELGRACSMRGMRTACSILVGKLERKIPPRRPRCRWEDNFRIDVGEVWWEGVDWIHLAQDRDNWWAFVNIVMNLQVL
jgi:hypothetical protein